MPPERVQTETKSRAPKRKAEEATAPQPVAFNRESTNRKKERPVPSHHVSGKAADLGAQHASLGRQAERASQIPASAGRTKDNSSAFRRNYFALVGRAQPATESVKGATSIHSTQGSQRFRFRLRMCYACLCAYIMLCESAEDG